MTRRRKNALPRRFWSKADLRKLRREYPHRRTDELAAELGRSRAAVYARADIEGVKKSAAFLKAELARCGRIAAASPGGIRGRFPKGHVPQNKGLRRPGWHRGRMRETQFKKGQVSHKWQPVGSKRMVDGYQYTKVTDIRLVPWTRNWRPTHVLLWEKKRGPLPAGFALRFKNGDRTDIRLGNLELISRADLMRRNTIHVQYPKELVQLIHLRGAVLRQIRRKRKAQDGQEQDGGPSRPPVRDARVAARRGKADGARSRRKDR